MKKILLVISLIFVFNNTAHAFACKTAAGAVIPVGGGNANVYVNLTPEVQAKGNLVVDLANSIFCHNDYPASITDYVTLASGSSFNGVLKNFEGSVIYNGQNYSFPTTSETSRVLYRSKADTPWPTRLLLTPISTAEGVVVNAGTLIASLVLHQTNNVSKDSYYYTWNIYASNSVVVPTGGCDVDNRNLTVNLPNYPGKQAFTINVHCATDKNLNYSLTGTTAGSSGNTLKNMLEGNSDSATGVGVQILKDGVPVKFGDTIKLGTVSSSGTNITLTAQYQPTSGQMTAGKVQSIAGMNFTYQ
ncbi:fimbrial protein [Rosenbergiella collisarenosi]|uniref:fimbrial protein n=1 Tax=Rosenbergiella collisarenosi TaxID=1544695 RepID=UPI001F4F48CB|nr:fimbrial protein [Rosenbergiella collisarenosi]